MPHNKKLDAETIARFFPLYKINPAKQMAKISNRIRLCDFWSIEKGSTILEIGCGQGDTTAVLAALLGRKGTVIAVDSADPQYGYHVNCEESSEHLLKAPFGKRIQFFYNFDIFGDIDMLPVKSFDYIVLSFSSWYLKNEITLINMLKIIRGFGGKLAFADWCIVPETIDQISHVFSVLIQNQIKLYNSRYETNICTILLPETLRQITKETGWNICHDAIIESTAAYDGISEVEKVTREGLQKILDSCLPEWFESILRVEIKLLESMKSSFQILPLSTYAFVAN